LAHQHRLIQEEIRVDLCPFESSKLSFKPVLGLASGVIYATAKEGRKEGRGQY
jgi:hypothetical protein